MRANFKSVLLSLITITGAASCADHDNERHYAEFHSDSGITGRPYDQIVKELKDLEAAHSGVAKYISYGNTVGGRELAMLRIAKPGVSSAPGQARPGVLIAGTIHGDEFLNIEDRLPRWFLENQSSSGVAKYLNAGGVIWIAPILNPDGYAARRRENNRGKDLNRDFDLKLANKKGFTQPETTALHQVIRQELTANGAQLKLTMDYHCCVGALIYPWGHSYDQELPANAKAEHLRLAKKIQEQFPRYRAGRAIEIVNYVAVGASDDFYHETFGATSFTFEGAVGVENRNFDRHTAMWDDLLNDQVGQINSQPVQPSVPPTSPNRPTIAILASDSSGINLAVAGPSGTASMVVCKGMNSNCSDSANILLNLSSGALVGERLVFKAAQTVAISSNEVLTVLARDAAGIVKQAATFRLTAR